MMVYEVDFDADGFEYEYDINAKTGAVVKFDDYEIDASNGAVLKCEKERD